MKNEDLKNSLPTLPKISGKAESNFRYRSKDENEHISIRIPADIHDKIQRQAFWSRAKKTEIINKILAQYYEEKDFMAIPNEEIYI